MVLVLVADRNIRRGRRINTSWRLGIDQPETLLGKQKPEASLIVPKEKELGSDSNIGVGEILS